MALGSGQLAAYVQQLLSQGNQVDLTPINAAFDAQLPLVQGDIERASMSAIARQGLHPSDGLAARIRSELSAAPMAHQAAARANAIMQAQQQGAGLYAQLLPSLLSALGRQEDRAWETQQRVDERTYQDQLREQLRQQEIRDRELARQQELADREAARKFALEDRQMVRTESAGSTRAAEEAATRAAQSAARYSTGSTTPNADYTRQLLGYGGGGGGGGMASPGGAYGQGVAVGKPMGNPSPSSTPFGQSYFQTAEYRQKMADRDQAAQQKWQAAQRSPQGYMSVPGSTSSVAAPSAAEVRNQQAAMGLFDLGYFQGLR